MEAGAVAPVPKPPEIGPFVMKGPKADPPEPEATVAKGLRAGGKIPDCPESVAMFRAGFVEVAVPVPSSVRVPCPG